MECEARLKLSIEGGYHQGYFRLNAKCYDKGTLLYLYSFHIQTTK